MKAVATEANEQSTAAEDALRRAVDTTPAFIHTGRPDGYLDYFNRGWLDFFGKSLEDVCGWPGVVLGVYNFKPAQEKGWERETRHREHSI
jgi:PAS domain-containing protein